MTAKDLFSNDPKYLEGLSEEQCQAVLAPYFNVTRPDETKRKKQVIDSKPQRKIRSAKTVLTMLEAKEKLLGL